MDENDIKGNKIKVNNVENNNSLYKEYKNAVLNNSVI